MKKALLIIFTLLLIFTFCACQSSEEKKTTTSADTTNLGEESSENATGTLSSEDTSAPSHTEIATEKEEDSVVNENTPTYKYNPEKNEIIVECTDDYDPFAE